LPAPSLGGGSKLPLNADAAGRDGSQAGHVRGPMIARPVPCHRHEDPPMDAIALLKEDHKKVKDLLEQLAKSTPRAAKKRTDLLRKIQLNLEVHTTIEEEIFYPAFKEAGSKSDDAKMYFEAMEEHRAAGDLVLPDLLQTQVDSEQFSGRAKVLKELVEHHVKEEEKSMFPRAKKLFSKQELGELGEQMDMRRSELMRGAR
jgi:hemerythrin-like domain-containing protein